MNNKQRVLVLMHPDLIPPESNEGFSEQDASNWKTEYDVVSTLRTVGYDVKPLGVHDELRPIRDEIGQRVRALQVRASHKISLVRNSSTP